MRGRSNLSRFIKQFSDVAVVNTILGISQRTGDMGPGMGVQSLDA